MLCPPFGLFSHVVADSDDLELTPFIRFFQLSLW